MAVILPKTDFPLRAAMAKRSEEFIERWQDFDLWAKLREQSRGREKFILHDGPPYANGHLHIGHALNKILKDIINRAQQMRGFDAHYIPGWDCHGLPIEWKVEEQYRAKGKSKDEVSICEFRAECRQFAQEWIEVQKREFALLGLIGDWQNPYQTMDYKSEARIAKEIGKFLISGNLNQSARPVLWSVAEKTALADAEVEYHQHVSQAIFVAFPLHEDSCAKLNLKPGTAILIWTTTPWTIPANRAIAFNKDFTYRLVRDKKSGLEFLIEQTCQTNQSLKRDWIDLERSFSGAELTGLLANHPLANHPDSKIASGYRYGVPLYEADFVTREQGSGFVHCAPSHGEDDFRLGEKHSLPCDNTVDADGYYTSAIPGFEGARIFDENGKRGDANQRVLRALAESKLLLAQNDYQHDYPHSWRSKTPLIFRNTSQWFIRMDWRGYSKGEGKGKSKGKGKDKGEDKGEGKGEDKSLREKALAEIERVQFFPPEGKKRLHDMIASRPDWCVSRQRLWGVPLPIFTHKQSGEVLREQSVIDRVAEVFADEGAGSWYRRDAQDFLPEPYKACDYEQCQDIVEVWFDSGSTHTFVLETRLGIDCADLYLEGSDQHRGWFHSSLLQACGTKGKAPYRAVLTHGFVLDEKGRKMSKSLGNITAPQKVLDKYGPDILRLWVAGSNYTGDLLIGEEILQSHSDMYRRFRNTLRFLIGNLQKQPVELPHLTKLPIPERALLAMLAQLDEFLEGCIEKHNFTPYINALYGFCNARLSGWYFDIRKDCLYCDGEQDEKRQHCLAVMEVLFEFLTRRLAPVLCFTAEEAFQALRRKREPDEGKKESLRLKIEESIHLQGFAQVQPNWKNDELAESWREFLKAEAWHGIVNSEIDRMRKEGQLGSSLEARLVFPCPDVNTWDARLKALGIEGSNKEDVLAEIFIVSDVVLDRESQSTDMKPRVEKITDWQKCERCWRLAPEVGKDSDNSHPRLYSSLCSRCSSVVEQKEKFKQTEQA